MDDIEPVALGGTVREPLTPVGEDGPELVQLPYGSYVHTSGETERLLARRDEGYGFTTTAGSKQAAGRSVVVDFSGATFNNTSRAEMNARAQDTLVPSLDKALDDRERSYGGWQR